MLVRRTQPPRDPARRSRVRDRGSRACAPTTAAPQLRPQVIVASAWLWRRLRPRPAGPALLWLRLCGPRLSCIIRSQQRASDRERSRQVGGLTASARSSRSARRGSPPPTPARAAVSAAPNLSSRCCGGCGASSAGSGSGSGPGSPAAAPHNTANVRRLSVASQPSQLWSKRLPSLLRHSRQRRWGWRGSDQLRRLRL